MQETIETNHQMAESKRHSARSRLAEIARDNHCFTAGAISVVPYFFSHYQDVRGEREYRLIMAMTWAIIIS